MFDILPYVAERQHLQHNGRKTNEPLYPQQFAMRMQISSCLFSLNAITAMYCGFNDLFLITTLVAICSFNHWRLPIIGTRRSIDLVAAQFGAFYHLNIAFHHTESYQWHLYIFCAILMFVCYLGAVLF